MSPLFSVQLNRSFLQLSGCLRRIRENHEYVDRSKRRFELRSFHQINRRICPCCLKIRSIQSLKKFLYFIFTKFSTFSAIFDCKSCPSVCNREIQSSSQFNKAASFQLGDLNGFDKSKLKSSTLLLSWRPPKM